MKKVRYSLLNVQDSENLFELLNVGSMDSDNYKYYRLYMLLDDYERALKDYRYLIGHDAKMILDDTQSAYVKLMNSLQVISLLCDPKMLETMMYNFDRQDRVSFQYMRKVNGRVRKFIIKDEDVFISKSLCLGKSLLACELWKTRLKEDSLAEAIDYEIEFNKR